MARGAKSTFIITIHSAFECCHNLILGYSPKFIFFQNKNKKIIIKTGNVEKVGREVKLQFLEEIQDLIVPHYAKK